jgi:negative regulator of sigma E activity
MTGDERRPAPPWSIDLLADLHAGALDSAREAELRPLVDADVEALAVLAALDATRAELADLPPLGMPDDVAARIDAALAAEANAHRPVAPVGDLATARKRRNQRLAWGAGLLTAAAVVIGVAVTVVPGTNPTTGVAQPGATTSTGVSSPRTQPPVGPLAITGDQLKSEAAKVIGDNDPGTLDSPQKMSECLKANGESPQAAPLGVRRVELDGRHGIMVILSNGKPASFRLLVVEPTCTAAHPGLIAKSTVGG